MKFDFNMLAITFLAFCLKKMNISKRLKFFDNLMKLLIKDTKFKESLKFLLELDNLLYQLEGETSVKYGKGIHTKHRHINYHQFFISNLNRGDHVLDIGCGNGFMSYDMVTSVEDVEVVGVDLNEANIIYANENYQHRNLKFIKGNVLNELPNKNFNVITLSNVLEHFEQRTEFLKRIVLKFKPRCLIIRVPFFERDWRVPLKKEVGVDYRLDPTHFIEYTKKEFFIEIKNAGLEIKQIEFIWGEIWSVVEPL